MMFRKNHAETETKVLSPSEMARVLGAGTPANPLPEDEPNQT